jgi:hypothetical protein
MKWPPVFMVNASRSREARSAGLKMASKHNPGGHPPGFWVCNVRYDTQGRMFFWKRIIMK